MQFAVERLDLRPQPLGFGLKLLGSHIVLRAPQGAGIGKAQLSRPLVAQFGQPCIIAAHRRSDCVPARPQGRKFFWIAALSHLQVEFVDTQAMIGIGVRAVPAAAIGGIQLRGLPGGFSAQRRILRRGQPDAQLQQQQLARRVGWQLEAVEAARLAQRQIIGGRQRLADQLRLPGNQPVVGFGQQGHRVVGDVSLLDPRGAIRIDAQRAQFLFRAGDEGEGLGDRGFGCGGALRRDGTDAEK